ncbi:LapA family protein [Lentilactobacillus kisonensis]|uniref:LapA family protein n=1 Tax=Lentilactobacillus kisonensis TaxID=481722 RepID=UPI0006D08054|nr:LapA family protein [Lentilactobacillus kisonensis]
MKKQITTIVSIILIIIIALFALINFESVDVNFGFTSVRIPLVLLILFSLLVGALIIFLLSSILNVKKNRQFRELESQSQQKQDELVKQIETLQTNLKSLETRLKNSYGKQEIGTKDQQITNLEAEIKKNCQTNCHKSKVACFND